MAAMLFACCARGKARNKRAQSHVYDPHVIPDEESRLIPTTEEPEIAVPDTIAEELDKRKARLEKIVRAKQGNMINTYSYGPFYAGRGRSISRSVSRDPSGSVARYGYKYGYGAVGHNPSLAHTISMPSPLEPEPSEVRVQIASAAEGRASVERSGSGSRKGTKGGSASGSVERTGNGTADASRRGSESHTPYLRPSLVMSPSSSSLAKSMTSSRESMSDSHGGTGAGLGVRVVRPLSLASGNMDRRGRPKVKAGGSFPSPIASGYTSASSGDGVAPAVQSGLSLEQTPRPLNGFPSATTPSTSTLTAPPSSPHSESDHLGDSNQNQNEHPPTSNQAGKKTPQPVFEIKDVGELTIDWD